MFYDFRSLFKGLEEGVPLANGHLVTEVNFDNAATTPPLKCVLESIVDFSPFYSSIHRGKGYKSTQCSQFYEEARKSILSIFNAPRDNYTVIFVKNTTEGMNKLSYRLKNNPNDVILTTMMEHHSNDLPWRERWNVDYIDIDKDGRLSLESLYKKLSYYNGRVKYVTITGASNVTGYVNDIHYIAKLCHNYGAKIIVDGAQLVPHKPVNMLGNNKYEAIDYLVFSAHKIYAPFGIGAIICPKDGFSKEGPEYRGGGTVKFVTKDEVIWDEVPYSEEAGTPNIIGVVALLSALQKIRSLDMNFIEKRENELTKYALGKLRERNYINLYGDRRKTLDRLSIIPFNIKGMHHNDVANLLSKQYGIAVRDGCFCAHPYVQRLLNISDQEIGMFKEMPYSKRPGMVRVSFGMYNTEMEIDRLINALDNIYYLKS